MEKLGKRQFPPFLLFLLYTTEPKTNNMKNLIFFSWTSSVTLFITSWFICYQIYRYIYLTIWKKTHSKKELLFWCRFFGRNNAKIKNLSSMTSIVVVIIWLFYYAYLFILQDALTILQIFGYFTLYVSNLASFITPFFLSLFIIFKLFKAPIRTAKVLSLIISILFVVAVNVFK